MIMGITRFLYHTAPGRVLLRPLASRPVSNLLGAFMETRASKPLVPVFKKMNHIDTADCDVSNVRCFNDFFCRPLLPGKRPFCMEKEALAAPCDGLLSVIPLQEDTVFPVKQSTFSLHSLLRDKRLAASYYGGTALVFRLTVSHYHRYSYFDSGRKSADRRIKGVYHTVQPVALEVRPVFTENSRCYTVIDSPSFGRCVQMEVGAMLVGRIKNNVPGKARIQRGEEKGHFLYGGSTIILLLPKDAADIDGEILMSSRAGIEYPVKMGERIGTCRKK